MLRFLMLTCAVLTLTAVSVSAQITRVEGSELSAAIENTDAKTILEASPKEISELTPDQNLKAVSILLTHLANLAPEDAVGRQVVTNFISVMVNEQLVAATKATDIPAGPPSEIPPEIKAALDVQDGAKLVAIVNGEDFSVTGVGEKKNDIIGMILSYAKPLPAANATANKEAYQALAILDPDNLAYKEKAQSYEQAERDAKAGALKRLKKRVDEFSGVTYYTHPAEPRYADTRSYLLPYIVEKGGAVYLRVELHYTADSWLFVDSASLNIDGKITPFNVPDSSWKRDNDSEIWEWSDTQVTPQMRALLKEVANSKKTIVRFDGRQYYDDFTVKDQDKAAIRDIFAAEAVLKDE